MKTVRPADGFLMSAEDGKSFDMPLCKPARRPIFPRVQTENY